MYYISSQCTAAPFEKKVDPIRTVGVAALRLYGFYISDFDVAVNWPNFITSANQNKS